MKMQMEKMDDLDESFLNENVKKIVAEIKKGEKIHKTEYIGVELEHFVVTREDKKSVPFFGEQGVNQIMKELLPSFPIMAKEGEYVIGLQCDEYMITLEPGAQLEISISPKKTITEVSFVYQSFRSLIDPILEHYHYELICMGYQPNMSVLEMDILPKKRYYNMDKYFEEQGPYGRCMMRGTASLQVSVDYFNEEDFVKKYRLLNILSPIIGLLADNTPVFEKEENKKYLKRYEIWENADRHRELMIPELFDPDFGYEKYALFCLKPPVINAYDQEEIMYSEETGRNLYASKEIDEKDASLILSMIFPVVRAKNYIEFRIMDARSMEESLPFVELLLLLTGEHAVEVLLEYFNDITVEDMKEAYHVIQKNGYESQIYGKAIRDIISVVFSLVEKVMDKKNFDFLKNLEGMVVR